jgi:hypothetical protein
MDCLSARGNSVSDAGDFCLATADSVLLDQPNGAGRRAHEGPAANDRDALSACERYRELLPRSFVDGFSGFAIEPGFLSIGRMSMTLQFPNHSRSYDRTRQAVRFWAPAARTMNPARMFLESLDRRPGIREQPGSKTDLKRRKLNVRFSLGSGLTFARS